MALLLIHIRPAAGGAWTVHPGDCPAPVSVHASETEAEREAFRLAAARGGDARVVVRDRYARPRAPNLAPARVQASAGTPTTIPRRWSSTSSL
jgi:hypothetical protein